MREDDVVQRIRKLAEPNPRASLLVRGIGDDCAVLRPKPNEDLVFTTDFVIENRHFTLATHKPAEIGYKALMRSLSDLAAMGSEPVFCFVSLALPSHLGARWIDSFYRGLLRLASQYQCALAGGDLSRAAHVVADVMCCGRVPRGKAMLRSNAKPGDRIYVTGQLGGAARALSTNRYDHRSEPRIEESIALRKRGVSCCMDLSDGLSLDLRRLCLESNVSASLSAIPIAAGATLDQALHGGEDYELLFTTSKRMPDHLGSTELFSIGEIRAGNVGNVLLNNRKLPPKGFDHFQ